MDQNTYSKAANLIYDRAMASLTPEEQQFFNSSQMNADQDGQMSPEAQRISQKFAGAMKAGVDSTGDPQGYMAAADQAGDGWQRDVFNVAKVVIPAMVGGAGLAATGAFGAAAQGAVGGGALGSAEAVGGGLLGGAGTGAGGVGGAGAGWLGDAAMGNAIAGSAATGAGELGTAAGAVGASGVGGGAATIGQAAGAGSGLLGGAGAPPSIPGSPPSVPGAPPSVVPPTGGGSFLDSLGGSLPTNAKDWLSLGGTLGGIANSLRPQEQAQMPDFKSLAEQQAKINADAAAKQTQANRPNQINAAGDTSTWTQDPATGAWTQKQSFGAGNQGLYDQSTALKGGLLGQAGTNGALTTDGLPQLGGPLMSAQGNSKEIQDAWMKLLQPDRDRARAGEVQRLKNQGLTEDSPAFQRAMERLDTGDTNAQNQALIQGTQEYGNIYNRDITGRSSQRGDYQTMFGARSDVHNQPYKDLQNLSGSVPGSTPGFGGFTSATGSPGADVYGASQDSYAAMLSQANAKNAANNNLTQGLFGLGSTFGKKP